jgi:hypothetical protein
MNVLRSFISSELSLPIALLRCFYRMYIVGHFKQHRAGSTCAFPSRGTVVAGDMSSSGWFLYGIAVELHIVCSSCTV